MSSWDALLLLRVVMGRHNAFPSPPFVARQCGVPAAIRSGRALPPVVSAPQTRTSHLRSRGASRFRSNPLLVCWYQYIAELMYTVA
jgi:hypothetical protein